MVIEHVNGLHTGLDTRFIEKTPFDQTIGSRFSSFVVLLFLHHGPSLPQIIHECHLAALQQQPELLFVQPFA